MILFELQSKKSQKIDEADDTEASTGPIIVGMSMLAFVVVIIAVTWWQSKNRRAHGGYEPVQDSKESILSSP